MRVPVCLPVSLLPLVIAGDCDVLLRGVCGPGQGLVSWPLSVQGRVPGPWPSRLPCPSSSPCQIPPLPLILSAELEPETLYDGLLPGWCWAVVHLGSLTLSMLCLSEVS